MNCSDFLSNINIEIGSNSNESKGKYINNIISNEEYKKTRTKLLNQIILNNFCFSRNKTNISSTKSICNSKKRGIKRPNICKTITLANPKKCLTRNNSNNKNFNILKHENISLKKAAPKSNAKSFYFTYNSSNLFGKNL
jgi:hypothetical protein